MTAYRCLAITAEGRADWRQVDAPSEQSAVARLLSEGLTPLDVRAGPQTIVERLNQPVRLRSRLRLSEQALILTQLGTLLRSGLPVDRSLDLIRDQATRGAQRELLARVVARVRAGGSLAAGFEEIDAFPAYVVGVIRSAERGGGLGAAMTSLAERMTLAATTRAQLVTALTYPVAVLAATVIALILVLTLVVPQFAPIFDGQEDKLPGLTRMVLRLSGLINDHPIALCSTGIIILASVVALGRYLGRSEHAEPWRGYIPGLALLDQYTAAQFLGVFATLVRSGLTIVAALPLARDAIAADRWRRGLDRAAARIREGASLSVALAGSKLIPLTALRLIEVGEESGALAATCDQASTIIARAAKARIDRAVALANPIAIVALGGLVGSMVAGVMLGIFSLGDFAG